MVLIALLSVLLSTLLLAYFVIKRRLETYVKDIPGVEPCYPFIGNVPQFMGKTMTEIFRDIDRFVKEKGTPNKTWLGPILVVNLDRPEDVRTVLMSPHCLEKPYLYRFLPAQFSILTMKSVTAWKRIRKALNPSFNLKILHSFVPVFNDKANIMLENMEKEANASSFFDVSEYMFTCTLDMICATTLGYDVDVQRNKNMDFLKSFQVVANLIGERFITFWCHPMFIYRWTSRYRLQKEHCDKIDRITSRIREEKKQEYCSKHKDIDAPMIDENSNETYKTPQAFIDQLFRLYFSGDLTETIVKEQIETMIIAGNETSALTVSYTILMLAIHPEIQERLFDELHDAYDFQCENTTNEHLQQLQYLDCVVKEGMRLFPIVPFIIRCVGADTPISKCTIPKHAFVMLSLYNLHRNKETWGPNAEDFNPDNFLPERTAQRHPFSFLPFGGGPRNCIGFQYAMLSMKVMLSGLIRRYRFATDLKMSELNMRCEMTLKLEGDHRVKVERREWQKKV